jgi:type II secretory pathway pseudopilin PulG
MGLVELMLVFAISSVVVAFSIRQYQGVIQEGRALKQVKHVSQVIHNLQALYGPKGYASVSTGSDPDYNCAVIPDIVQPELLSPSADCPSGTPMYRSAYNISEGRIQVQPVTKYAPSLSPIDYVALVWNHVPSGQCVPLVLGTESLAQAVLISGEPQPDPSLPQPDPKFLKPLNDVLHPAMLYDWCLQQRLVASDGTAKNEPADWVQIIYIVSR